MHVWIGTTLLLSEKPVPSLEIPPNGLQPNVLFLCAGTPASRATSNTPHIGLSAVCLFFRRDPISGEPVKTCDLPRSRMRIGLPGQDPPTQDCRLADRLSHLRSIPSPGCQGWQLYEDATTEGRESRGNSNSAERFR